MTPALAPRARTQYKAPRARYARTIALAKSGHEDDLPRGVTGLEFGVRRDKRGPCPPANAIADAAGGDCDRAEGQAVVERAGDDPGRRQVAGRLSSGHVAGGGFAQPVVDPRRVGVRVG